MKYLRPLLAPVLLAISAPVWSCDLCAVYNATSAKADFDSGFSFSLAEQFVHHGTELFDDQRIRRDDADYLDSSITHLVPGYNFSPRFGVSLNLPLVARSFRRTDLRYTTGGLPALETERGSEFGVGDAALIGRGTIFTKRTMKYDVTVNLLGGVKFPTGDTDRLKDEISQTDIYNDFLPPGTPHDPLSHSISSVHQHSISAGSGSFDGLFGVTLNTRWDRWFFNSQAQYSLRTAGESGFHYGDDLLISGGPGRFLLATEDYSLSLQALAVYNTMGRDTLEGRISDRTGQTAWYLGPQINFTWSGHFTANLGVDVPLHITANGFQAVPDYRLHGGVSWRF